MLAQNPEQLTILQLLINQQESLRVKTPDQIFESEAGSDRAEIEFATRKQELSFRTTLKQTNDQIEELVTNNNESVEEVIEEEQSNNSVLLLDSRLEVPTLELLVNEDGTLTLSGTGEPGAEVSITLPSGETLTGTVDKDGNYGPLTSSGVEPSGELIATQTDEGGNESDETKVDYSDITPPPAPVITEPSTVDENGNLVVKGTGEVGAKVEVTFPDETKGIGIVDENGEFTVTSQNPQTSGAVTATQTDEAGNRSEPDSEDYKDVTPPPAPVITEPSTVDENGNLVVKGTGEVGAEVEVTFPDETKGIGIVDENGEFTVTSQNPQTSGAVTATQTDEAGNKSEQDSEDYKDVAPPPAPVISEPSTVDEDGNLVVKGIGEVGAEVEVTFPDGTTGTSLVDENGEFTVTSENPQKSGEVTATQTDEAGNKSEQDLEDYKDVTPPSAPDAKLTVDSGDTTDGITNDASITPPMNIEEGAKVEYSLDGTTWTETYTAPTEDGEYTVKVRQTDKAGNVSEEQEISFTLDTTVAIPDVKLAVDSADEDGITNDATLTEPTNLEEGAKVEYSLDGTTWTQSYTAPTTDGDYTVKVRQTDKAGNVSEEQEITFTLDTTVATPDAKLTTDSGDTTDTVTNDGSITPPSNVEDGAVVEYQTNGGEWSNTYTAPTTDGDYTVKVRQTDKAGNVSEEQEISFTLDTTVATPDVKLAVDSGDTTDTITNDATLTEPTNIEEGAKVEYSLDGTTWTSTYTAPTEDGEYTVKVRQTDKAGNVSEEQEISFTLDTTVATPDVKLAVDSGDTTDTITNDATLTEPTNIEEGAKVEYSLDGTTWTQSYTAPTEDGDYTVKVRQTDKAGNVSEEQEISFTLDTTVATPDVKLAVDSGDTTDTITNDATLTEPTNIEEGAKVEYSLDGTTWTQTYSAPTEDGEYTVKVRQTDKAGNVSEEQEISFTLDTTADVNSDLEVIIASNIDRADKGAVSYSLEGLDPDATATLTFSSPLGGKPIVITVKGTDDLSDLKVDLTTLRSGNFSVVTTVTDVAGNNSTAESKSFYIPTSVPTAQITADTINDSMKNSVEYTLSDLDLDVNATVVFTSSNGGVVAVEVNENGTKKVDLSSLPDGEITVRVFPSGAPEGNGDTAILDTTAPGEPIGAAPTVVISTDSDDDGFINKDENNGATKLSSEITLPQGLIVGDFIIVTDGTTEHSLEVTDAMLTEGKIVVEFDVPAQGESITVTAWAEDAAGNKGTESNDSVTLDTTAPNTDAPTLSFVEDENSDGNLTIEESEKDTDGMMDVEVSLPADLEEGCFVIVTDGTTTYRLSASDFTNGKAIVQFTTPGSLETLSVEAYATDAALNPSSNKATADLIVKTIDAPTLSFVEDINSDSYLNIEESANDADKMMDVEVSLPSNLTADEFVIVEAGGVKHEILVSEFVDGKTIVQFTTPADGSALVVKAYAADKEKNKVSKTVEESLSVDTTVPSTDAPTLTFVENTNNDKYLNIDEIENDGNSTTSVEVTLPTNLEEGGFVVVTDGMTTHTLSASDFTSGKVVVEFNTPSNGSVLKVEAYATDAVLNPSPNKVIKKVTIDTEFDDATISLTTDTKGDIGTKNDGITKNNGVTVNGLEDKSVWQYSIDGGKSWTDGSGNTFNLDMNKTYEIGDIVIRTADKAGNVAEYQMNKKIVTHDDNPYMTNPDSELSIKLASKDKSNMIFDFDARMFHNDPDDNNVTYKFNSVKDSSKNDQSSLFEIDQNSGEVTIKDGVTLTYPDTYTFKVKITDIAGNSVVKTLVVDTTNKNSTTLFGTEQGNTLKGSESNKGYTIFGFSGNDTIDGRGKDDHLYGGAGK